MDLINREIQSPIETDASLRIWLEDALIRRPGPDEVIVWVEAAPLNLSGQILLLGPVDSSTLRQLGPADRPIIEGLGAAMLIGRTVAIRGKPGTYWSTRPSGRPIV